MNEIRVLLTLIVHNEEIIIFVVVINTIVVSRQRTYSVVINYGRKEVLSVIRRDGSI